MAISRLLAVRRGEAIERCKARCPLLSTAEVFVLIGCRLVPDCGRKFATNGVKLSGARLLTASHTASGRWVTTRLRL